MPFALDYFLLVFIAACGIVQIAATYSRLEGLYVFNNRFLNLLAGGALIAGPFVWFFLSEPRNVPDIAGGLNGNQQALLFVAGCLAAVAFTCLGSSLLHPRLKGPTLPRKGEEQGLDTLRRASFFWALRSTFRNLLRQ